MPLSAHTYLIFIASVVVLCLVPGPDMAYMLGRTLTQGRRAGLVAAVGINTGGYAHVTAAVLGLSAILMTSAVAFTVVKLTGAAYLVWIGVRTLASSCAARSAARAATQPMPASLRRIFWEGFLSDALNPKVSAFFLAFLPQFVDRGSSMGVPAQLLFLGVTCNVVALSINAVLVVLAGRLTHALRAKDSWRMWQKRLLGGLFIALGLRLAGEKL